MHGEFPPPSFYKVEQRRGIRPHMPELLPFP
jgi:hypothetical protein